MLANAGLYVSFFEKIINFYDNISCAHLQTSFNIVDPIVHREMLQHEKLLANTRFDRAKKEPSEVCCKGEHFAREI